MIRRSPLSKPRTTPRTRKCSGCAARITSNTCPECHTRKNTSRTSIKARCDSLARQLSRLLADGKCARCGGPGSDWAHRASRRHHSVRWDVVGNSDFLCRPCHRYFTDRPFAFTAWLVSRGVDVDAIEARAAQAWNRDYGQVLAELTDALARAKGEQR